MPAALISSPYPFLKIIDDKKGVSMPSINQMIDHTLLRPSATEKEITALCQEAIQHQFASVCVNPCHLPLTKRLLVNTDVKLCTVIGFPLGANRTEIKVAETEAALRDGCDEFDMVINIGALKGGDDDKVLSDIAAVVAAAKGKCVKVIIETFFLTDEEKIRAVRLASLAGAAFVKTCTGFNEGRATANDISLMKTHAGEGVLVKASGGIRSYKQALAMIEAGASRIGTSAGVKIAAESMADQL